MKKLLFIILLFAGYANGQTVTVTAPAGVWTPGTNASLNLNPLALNTRADSLANAVKLKADQSALTTVNQKLDGNINQTATNRVDIAALKAQVAALQAGSTSLPALPLTGSYTLLPTDNGRVLSVNCSGCTITLPVLSGDFKCFIVRENGVVYVSPSSGVTRTGATYIAAKNGGQWVTYKNSNTVNVQVR